MLIFLEPNLFKANDKLFTKNKLWFARQLSPEWRYWGETAKQVAHVYPMLGMEKDMVEFFLFHRPIKDHVKLDELIRGLRFDDLNTNS
jgi:hypothetical protein